MGIGHAFEINPATPDQVVYQIADAQLVRQLFPEASPKYMPPTKYMPGDIFQGHIIDGMFNFTGIFTGQEIMLLGMLTEEPVSYVNAPQLARERVREQLRLRAPFAWNATNLSRGLKRAPVMALSRGASRRPLPPQGL